ncbi:MAG: radical SAM protein, partial [Thermoprotei archaeon]
MGVVYGPVLSWRFGSSLGIDLISGSKVCTFD